MVSGVCSEGKSFRLEKSWKRQIERKYEKNDHYRRKWFYWKKRQGIF